MVDRSPATSSELAPTKASSDDSGNEAKPYFCVPSQEVIKTKEGQVDMGKVKKLI